MTRRSIRGWTVCQHQSLAVRSFMCAPLWHEDEIIGLLYVDNPRTDQFTAADLDLFTAFSNYAAVAIAQARMAARVLEEQRQRERLERYHSPAVADRIVKGSDGGRRARLWLTSAISRCSLRISSALRACRKGCRRSRWPSC